MQVDAGTLQAVHECRGERETLERAATIASRNRATRFPEALHVHSDDRR